MIKMIEINDSQFNTVVLKSALPVLLECASPECIICKTMAERISEVAKDHSSEMLFLRLDINENKRWQDFNVRVIPTLLYFKDGVLVARQDAFPDVEEIRRQVQLMIKKNNGGGPIAVELKTAADI
jgi:thioredoxin 1